MLIAIITLLGMRLRFLSRRNAWLQEQLDAMRRGMNKGRHTGRHRAPPEGEHLACGVCPETLVDTSGGSLEHHDDGSHTYHPARIAWELEDGDTGDALWVRPAGGATATIAMAETIGMQLMPWQKRSLMALLPDIWTEVHAERERAHAKHGDKSMEAAPWTAERRLRILLEEVGEVAREFNDAEIEGRRVDAAAVRRELLQVAAMAGAWADVCPTEAGA